MSRFQEEFKVIPPTAKGIAVLTAVAFATGMAWLVYVGGGSDFRNPGNWFLKPLLIGLAPLLIGLYVLVVGYVFGDARRRRMRYVLWTFLAFFLPQALGIILYFILRDPLPLPCPNCRATAPGNFAFCPFCGTALKPTCPQCGKSVEHGWTNCAYCGKKLELPGANAA